MTMKKNLLAASVFASLTFSGAVLAEVPPGSQGNGVIKFEGSVLAAPCGLAPGADGDNQLINLGQVSDAQLTTTGYTTPVEFRIKLIGCTFDPAATEDTTAKVRFDGPSVGGTKGYLGVSGDAKGVAIRLLDAANEPVIMHTNSSPYTLRTGDNTLLFAAQLIALNGAGSKDVKAGHYDTLTNFSLIYK